MPTYEYRCAKGHEFEVFQRMSDDPVDTCPECGASAERRISAGAGFLFKGDGFYITDYRSADYKKKASTETGSPKAADGSSGAETSSSSGSSGGTSSGGGTPSSGGASSSSAD